MKMRATSFVADRNFIPPSDQGQRLLAFFVLSPLQIRISLAFAKRYLWFIQCAGAFHSIQYQAG